MRGKLAAAALAAGLLAGAAGCGGGDDGRSTEEICNDLNAATEPLEADLNAALAEAGLAAGQGDDTALAAAVVDLNDVVGQIAGAVRGAADDAEDEDFRAALDSYAIELESLPDQLESGSVPDPAGVLAAGDGVKEHCR